MMMKKKDVRKSISMWIKRRSWLLVVRVRSGGRFPIIVPVSLAVLHETIMEAKSWLELWEAAAGKHAGYQLACAMVQWLFEFVESIRAVGRLRLVEVETPEADVFIDLW